MRKGNRNFIRKTNKSSAARKTSVKRGGNRAPHSHGETIRGTVQGSGRGFAFLIPFDKSGDLFIAGKNLMGAIHGDEVEAEIISSSRARRECAVVKVLRRVHFEVVGVYDGECVLPRDRGFGKVYVDDRGSLPAKIGDLVVGKLAGGYPLECRITEVLGGEDDITAGLTGIVRSYNLCERFPREVTREAAAVPDRVSEDEMGAKGRKDFRGEITVTIDGAHSKDFDDAICVTRAGDGYRLGVYIADVAHYVREGSALDREALRRGTSVYFADRVLPMLPEKLSNGICSLNEGEDRLTMCCVMDFDREGRRIGYFVCEGVIRSKARLTYAEAEAIIAGDEAVQKAKPKAVVGMLKVAAELARLLKTRRDERGAVEFDLAECEIEMAADGTVADVRKKKRMFSEGLIEEFMLAANETVAEHFCRMKVPFVYRVHEAPPAEKVEALGEFLSTLGLSIPASPRPADYRKLLESCDGAVKGIVDRVALRSMSKADYRTECMGHYGLAAEFYCHFTSPIRRYPDLAIHRIIKYVLSGGRGAEKKFGEFAKDAAARSSERERISDEAERSADDFLKAQFMRDKIGREYDAVVSGVTEWGLFAEIDNGIEGMIRVESLGGGEFDEGRLALVTPARTFRLGDRIRIEVESVNYDKVSFLPAK